MASILANLFTIFFCLRDDFCAPSVLSFCLQFDKRMMLLTSFRNRL